MDVTQQTNESYIMQEMSCDNLKDKTRVELLSLAKNKKVKNYSKMKKADLIKILREDVSQYINCLDYNTNSKKVLLKKQKPLIY